MKIDRHGQAKILSQAEIQLLFNQGLQSYRDHAQSRLTSRTLPACLLVLTRLRFACIALEAVVGWANWLLAFESTR